MCVEDFRNASDTTNDGQAAAEVIQLHLYEAARLARLIDGFSDSELFAYFMDMGAGLVRQHKLVKLSS